MIDVSRHVATLHWSDRNGRHQTARFAALEPVDATTPAYRRAKSLMLAGDARAYTIRNTIERVPLMEH